MKKLASCLTLFFCASIFAQDLPKSDVSPKIAVYVIGDNVHFNERNALGTRIFSSLVERHFRFFLCGGGKYFYSFEEVLP